MDLNEREKRLWPRTLRLTGALLALWFGVTFGVAFFARDLNFHLFGWPFSVWVGAQGALIVYVIIIWAYARWMDRLEAGQPGARGGE
jgi:putative solute:sodium symporter small subunit